LAQRGKTCLLEADMRRPAASKMFGVEAKVGLSHLLTGGVSQDSVVVPIPDVENLSVLPSGPAVPSPADLITSAQLQAVVMSLRSKFEYVVIDSPPVIPFSDTRFLSSVVDAVVLVARYALTTRRAFKRCTQLLDEVGAPIVGFVLNDIELSSPDYHYYNYGYSKSLRTDLYYSTAESSPAITDGEMPPKSRGAHA
jgi:capsular exopolysaccharide synthesis family protein